MGAASSTEAAAGVANSAGMMATTTQIGNTQPVSQNISKCPVKHDKLPSECPMSNQSSATSDGWVSECPASEELKHSVRPSNADVDPTNMVLTDTRLFNSYNIYIL